MPAYPSIPFFQDRDGWQETPGDNVIRTQMSVGPAKVRRRTTSAPTLMSARVAYFTDAELTTFYSFFENDLSHGSLSFTAAHPRTGVTEDFRFVGQPSVVPRGEGFSVTADLEILP